MIKKIIVCNVCASPLGTIENCETVLAFRAEAKPWVLVRCNSNDPEAVAHVCVHCVNAIKKAVA